MIYCRRIFFIGCVDHCLHQNWFIFVEFLIYYQQIIRAVETFFKLFFVPFISSFRCLWWKIHIKITTKYIFNCIFSDSFWNLFISELYQICYFFKCSLNINDWNSTLSVIYIQSDSFLLMNWAFLLNLNSTLLSSAPFLVLYLLPLTINWPIKFECRCDIFTCPIANGRLKLSPFKKWKSAWRKLKNMSFIISLRSRARLVLTPSTSQSSNFFYFTYWITCVSLILFDLWR